MQFIASAVCHVMHNIKHRYKINKRNKGVKKTKSPYLHIEIETNLFILRLRHLYPQVMLSCWNNLNTFPKHIKSTFVLIHEKPSRYDYSYNLVDC